MNPIDAVFDGSVFRPNDPVNLEPNTKVRLTITSGGPGSALQDPSRPKIEFANTPKNGEPGSALQAMREANLEGPPDWSENIHKYLYGEGNRGDDTGVS